MMPKEVSMLFPKEVANFTPIVTTPTVDNLTNLRERLHPILLSIPYNEDGNHNLIGLIKPTAFYKATWKAPFPIPDRPLAYDPNIATNVTPVVEAHMEAAHNRALWDYATYEAAE